MTADRYEIFLKAGGDNGNVLERCRPMAETQREHIP